MRAKTVNEAFDLFIREVVNLDPGKVKSARASRENLLANIHGFSGDQDFFYLYQDFDIQFGSFARGTKLRPLDDIDLMIGLSGRGSTYDSDGKWDNVHIYASTDESLMECTDNDGTLNSIKILNRFKSKLRHLLEYSHSDVKRNQQAVVLNLLSKDWSFDIVPCFYTTTEADGRNYYLIPNGQGEWMKTDPVMDKQKLKIQNLKLENKLKPLIRLMKKWNRVKQTKTIPSYAMETLIVNSYSNKYTINDYLDIAFCDCLLDFSEKILRPIGDIKGIQGDLNELNYTDRKACSSRAKTDWQKAYDAFVYKQNGQYESAINLWREIFGEDFPQYGE